MGYSSLPDLNDSWFWKIVAGVARFFGWKPEPPKKTPKCSECGRIDCLGGCR